MSVEAVTLFLALLAVLSFVVSVALLVSYLTGDRLGLWASVRPLATEFAAAVAVTATAGSLYLSEGAGFEPCQLCWYQRAFMYPAAVLLTAAVVTRRGVLKVLGGLLALIGLPISIFHRYDQSVGGIGDFCDPVVPCNVRYVNEFGFMTIPTMAGLGFLAIVVLVGLSLLNDRADRRVGADHDLDLESDPALAHDRS